MKKKLLTIVPLFALLASCNGAATVSEPLPSYVPNGASEMDVYEPSQIPGQEKRESSFSNSVKQSAKAFENAEAYELKEEMNFTTDIALKAKVAENLLAAFISTKDPTYVSAAMAVHGEINEKSALGIGGFNKENASLQDLVGYFSLSDLDANASLDYVIPETYLALLFQDGAPMENVGSANYNISNFALNGFLKDETAYLSIDDAKAKNLYDQILATDFVDFASILPTDLLNELEQETYEVPTFDQMLEKLGLETLGVSLPLPTEYLQDFDVKNIDLYKQIPEDFFAQSEIIDDLINNNKELLKNLNFRAFSFDDNNDYLLSLSLTINKDTISGFYNMFKKENDISFEQFLEKYNGLINKFDVTVEVNILRNGGMELSLSGGIDFKLDLTSVVIDALKAYLVQSYPAIGEMEGIEDIIAKIVQSVSIEFTYSGNTSLSFAKVAMDNINSHIPTNLNEFTDISGIIADYLTPVETPIE